MQNLGTSVVGGGGMPESNTSRAAGGGIREGSEGGGSQAGPACTEGGATGLPSSYLPTVWVGGRGPDFKSCPHQGPHRPITAPSVFCCLIYKREVEKPNLLRNQERDTLHYLEQVPAHTGLLRFSATGSCCKPGFLNLITVYFGGCLRLLCPHAL